MNVKVKICGITNVSDAQHAVDVGVDALGFVFWKKSPRYVSPEDAAKITSTLPPFVNTVGVFVDESYKTIIETIAKVGLDCVQLHGSEGPDECCELSHKLGARVIKAVRVSSLDDVKALVDYKVCNVAGYLLDSFKEGTPGGTGECFDWELAKEAKSFGLIILAGGLNAENVAEAIRLVRPYGVDVSSGVESSPGKKDHEKILVFMERVRSVERTI
jgi:phosphoribosylanthranilate isomerase